MKGQGFASTGRSPGVQPSLVDLCQGTVLSREGLTLMVEPHKGSHSPEERGSKPLMHQPTTDLQDGISLFPLDTRSWSIETDLSHILPTAGVWYGQHWLYLVLQCYGDNTEASPRGSLTPGGTYTCWVNIPSLLPSPFPTGLGA